MFRKSLALIYFVAVHVLLGIAIVKAGFVSSLTLRLGYVTGPPTAWDWRAAQAEMDPVVPTGATLFLGDSITTALATAALAPCAVNYGIPGQESGQLIETIDRYHSLQRAGSVVITIGTNDILGGHDAELETRYRTILAKMPASTPVVMSSVPPLGNVIVGHRMIENADVRSAVASARSACTADPRCRFVDAYAALTTNGTPTQGALLPDGIHLSAAGYRLLINAMRPALAESQASKDCTRGA